MMKTLFKASLGCAVATLFGLITLSAMTVAPEGAKFHAYAYFITLGLFLASFTLAVFSFQRSTRFLKISALTMVALIIGAHCILCSLEEESEIQIFDGIGGMPPTFDAKDFDPTLENEAKGAATLIHNIEEYQLTHQRYPATLKEIGRERSGWEYYVNKDGKSYSIGMRLGWDPCLFYMKSASNARWVFAPGDGTPDKEIKLSTPPPSPK